MKIPAKDGTDGWCLLPPISIARLPLVSVTSGKMIFQGIFLRRRLGDQASQAILPSARYGLKGIVLHLLTLLADPLVVCILGVGVEFYNLG